MKQILAFLIAGAALAAGVIPVVDIKTLNKNPEKFFGQEVTVTGKVDRIESAKTFVLDGPGIFNRKILVVVDDKSVAKGPKGTATPIQEGKKLEVTGKVEEIGITRFEERYGPAKTELKAEFEGNIPVLIAHPTGIKPM